MKISRWVLVLSILAAGLLLLAGPGTRLGLWPYGTGFLLMRWAFFAALTVAGLAVLLLIIPSTRRASAGWLVAALLIAAGTAWVPYQGLKTARTLPYIHDISTDTEDPPAFVDVRALRADAPNPPEYPGAEVAAQQREAYPDVVPLRVPVAPAQAFERALEIARQSGWEIVAVVPAEGRIEATATTFWFGFKDDVVIRVRPDPVGSRVDIRSKSRLGRSDVGANADRIRKFSAAMTAAS